MLETVKQKLNNLENKTFPNYYMEYVLAVQDMNIENEFSYLKSVNELTPMRICKLADKSMERLVDYFDRSQRSKE